MWPEYTNIDNEGAGTNYYTQYRFKFGWSRLKDADLLGNLFSVCLLNYNRLTAGFHGIFNAYKERCICHHHVYV